MNPEKVLTGGARIGWFNATWPFAKLRADSDAVTLKVAFSGTYIFPASAVVAIRKFVHIPFVGWGVRIEHTVSGYPSHIVFWFLGYPATVLDFLRRQGFPAEKIEA